MEINLNKKIKNKKYKNGLIILIDAARFDVFSNKESRNYLFPNLSKLIDESVNEKCVANSKSTQFVLPSLFCQSYPLDYNGYDNGIRDRPCSFVELLKESGYSTYFIGNCNQVGVTNGYYRGFDNIKNTVDFKILMEHRLARTILPRIKNIIKNKDKKNVEEYIVSEFGLFLDTLISGIEKFDKILWSKKLSKFNQSLFEGLKEEKEILINNPQLIIDKIFKIPPGLYWKFLGQKYPTQKMGYFLFRVGQAISWRVRKFIDRNPKIFPFNWFGHISVKINSMSQKLIQFFDTLNTRRPWFVYFHIMDAHDFRDISNPVHYFSRFKFFPKWLWAKLKKYTKRNFLYDSSIMNIDESLKNLITKFKNESAYSDTVIMITADHASSRAHSPKRNLVTKEKFLEMYSEDIDIPFSIFNTKSIDKKDGLIDTMGMSATFLEAINFEKKHKSFKGKSLFLEKRKVVISEHAGRGSSDVQNNDLYFVATSENYRLFLTLVSNNLSRIAFFDLKNDPNEKFNLIKSGKYINEIEFLTKEFIQERKDILDLRKNLQIL